MRPTMVSITKREISTSYVVRVRIVATFEKDETNSTKMKLSVAALLITPAAAFAPTFGVSPASSALKMSTTEAPVSNEI
jgi:hypothetical protein